MGLAFGATKQFEKDLKRLSKRYKLLFDDIEPVVHSIKAGERVGFRLIYAYFEGKQRDAVIALALYCKQDVATIRDKDLIRLIAESQDVLASIDPSIFEGEELH